MHDDPQEMAKRLRQALELSDAAEEIMRQNLRRRNPAATAEEIEKMVDDWFLKRDEPLDLGPYFRVRKLKL